jgi:hypothetical protein
MNTRITTSFISAATGIAFVAMTAIPAFAATTTPQTISSLQAKGDQSATKVTNALTKLETRIQNMKKLSSATATTLTTELQTQLSTIASLKAKIDADTDISVLKTDLILLRGSIQITSVLDPQIRITGSADRISTISAQMATVENKLQTRITAAQAKGKDESAAQTSLGDIAAKLADANTQYAAAQSEVTPLAPVVGDKAGIQADKATLKDAQLKIKIATQDLKDVRADISAIRTDLK